MVKRHASASFGGAWVFPGGVLDADDETAAKACATLNSRTADATLGLESGGLAYFSAAVRELFEETGLLLADAEPTDADALRSCLLEGTQPWSRLVADNNIKLALERLYYVSYWITPAALPKRYSTRFFIAEYAGNARPLACGGEVLDCRWLSARRALEFADQGQIELHFPTRITLEGLARHANLGSLMQWASCRAKEGVACIFPDLPEREAVLEAVAKSDRRE